MAEVIIQTEDELCTDEVVQFANEAKQCVELYSRKNHVTLTKKEAQIKDESVDDTLRDLACYSMMMLAYRKRQIEKEHSKIDFE